MTGRCYSDTVTMSVRTDFIYTTPSMNVWVHLNSSHREPLLL